MYEPVVLVIKLHRTFIMQLETEHTDVLIFYTAIEFRKSHCADIANLQKMALKYEKYSRSIVLYESLHDAFQYIPMYISTSVN